MTCSNCRTLEFDMDALRKYGMKLEADLSDIGEKLNEANERAKKQGKCAVEMFDELKRVQTENKELKDQNSKLADELEDCYCCDEYDREDESMCNRCLTLDKIIAKLRGEE